ncbi:MAG TPA: hypothetical protein VJG30_04940 [Candidatus Nanoarchaeia archaeon]|nr:hypothetical protein [Candidatus Nanoarchaeia archaeon]
MSLKDISKSTIVLLVVVILSILAFLFLPLLLAVAVFLAVLLPVIIFVLIKKWISKTFASVVFSFSVWLNIVIVLIPLFAGFAALNFAEFSKSLSSNDKVIAIDDNGLIFAFQFKDFNNVQSVKIYSSRELKNLRENLASDNLNNLMIFIINKKIFDPVKSISMSGIVLSNDEAFEFLASEDSNAFLSKKLGAAQKDISSDNMKVMAVFKLFEGILNENSAIYIVSSYKSGLIEVYPDYFSLRLIKYLPDAVLENAVSSLMPSQKSSNKNVNKQDIKHDQPLLLAP